MALGTKQNKVSKVLITYEINHIWTAEMKWKWRNDRRSERNLCNCVKKPEKNSGLQRGLNPWPRDTGAMLYQLSYEATDVGSRSIVGSYVPVKKMSVNDIWNKSYMNCGNEMKMKKWSSQWTQFTQLRKEAWKKFRIQRGLSPWPRDTGEMLYQLSYEATDVGSRSIFPLKYVVLSSAASCKPREK